MTPLRVISNVPAGSAADDGAASTLPGRSVGSSALMSAVIPGASVTLRQRLSPPAPRRLLHRLEVAQLRRHQRMRRMARQQRLEDGARLLEQALLHEEVGLVEIVLERAADADALGADSSCSSAAGVCTVRVTGLPAFVDETMASSSTSSLEQRPRRLHRRRALDAGQRRPSAAGRPRRPLRCRRRARRDRT